jgi:hypothetical protein
VKPDTENAEENRLLAHAPKLPDAEQTRKTRPIYLLRLQPIHGDGVRELRRLLKYSGRYLGLKALSVREEKAEVMPS